MENMDKFSLLNGVATIAVFVSLLLAFFLLTVKTQKRLSNRLFAGFILLCAIDISGFFINKYLSAYPNLDIFRGTISFLIIPSFYLYVVSVCYTDFKIKPKHIIHVIPFVVYNLVLTPRFYSVNDYDKILMLQHLDQMPEWIFGSILIKVQSAVYIIAIFLVLKKYKNIYLENYTSPIPSTYKWLLQITILLSFTFPITLIKDLLRYSGWGDVFTWVNIIIGTVALCMLCWFVLKALYYPELFRGIDSNLLLVKDIVRKPEISKELEQATNIQIELLKKYMHEHNPHLDPDLTIQDLALKVNMPVRDLSMLINHHMGQHFFDFINEYRIKNAMQLLRNPDKKEVTVLEILYEVGFNSKSSFNTAFKKHTNHTPTEYRNNSF